MACNYPDVVIFLSLNILIKLMSIVAVVTVRIYGINIRADDPITLILDKPNAWGLVDMYARSNDANPFNEVEKYIIQFQGGNLDFMQTYTTNDGIRIEINRESYPDLKGSSLICIWTKPIWAAISAAYVFHYEFHNNQATKINFKMAMTKPLNELLRNLEEKHLIN